MTKNKEYTAINIPKELAEEMKIWRKAFTAHYPCRDVTYESMIREMLDAFSESHPDVKTEYERITAAIEKEERI